MMRYTTNMKGKQLSMMAPCGCCDDTDVSRPAPQPPIPPSFKSFLECNATKIQAKNASRAHGSHVSGILTQLAVTSSAPRVKHTGHNSCDVRKRKGKRKCVGGVQCAVWFFYRCRCGIGTCGWVRECGMAVRICEIDGTDGRTIIVQR